MPRIVKLLILFTIYYLLFTIYYTYAQEVKSPIVVNGDEVEYSTDSKEVTATGNVVVIYKDSKLTCKKLTVNTQTKDGVASGDVRLEDKRGIIKAEKMEYNFETQKGKLIEAEITSVPFYGKSDMMTRLSENRFDAKKGYVTTCSLDKPHYRILSRKIEFYRGDKVIAKNDIVYIGGIPILYLPGYTHSLKDPLMNVQLMPGKSKEWGPYMLSAWRYSLTDSITGRIYLDYRQKLGVAEGFGANYKSKSFGKGDFKYYYTHERTDEFKEDKLSEFQRYFLRWRHQWDIDPRTNLTSEFYKIVDSKREIHGSDYNVLKDYFPREYEKDTQPLSYVLLHRTFNYASMSFIMQKRINNWYTHTNQLPDEKLPEVSFDLPSYKIGDSPLYIKNQMMFSNLNNENVISSSDTQSSIIRFDTYNQLSLPSKLLFIWVNPYVGARETFYNKDINGATLWGSPRTTFYSGVEMSAKFYRLFNLRSNFLGMDINGFRHIITPIITYAYNHEPTILSSSLKQFDSLDSITRSNKVTLELENKLQTKNSDSKTVDFATFRVTTDYLFKPKVDRGSSFSDFLFKLELLPYSWLRVYGDSTFKHSGGRSDVNYNRFSQANIDFDVSLNSDFSLGIGHRYERKGGKEMISQLNWRLNPKWKFKIYERYQFADVRGKGLREQEYTLSRDLHCWETDLTYNVNREKGETLWLVFRLKAFPELEFGLDQSYHQPKPGSQAQ